MKLSVIIVNYNVRAYLEQCLRTVFEAMKGVDGDVYVVDNLSTDGSVEMVREKFPQVKLIANQENVGFSRANNQAIRESTAEHVVLLNPDTVVGEDVFRKVIAFLDAHPKVGGLGVKMIDGNGRFLPESKRGLPTPSVAFYKIIGLTRLFPRSRIFGRYHLGHLPEDEPARIEILSGACMFMRKRTLDEVGLLDESFFMYGEDIDLSYRITLGGYENWYFPDARIIHYKGESTKKSSVNYVFVFYNAMAIFAKKHFTRKRFDVLAVLINASIYLSAAGAIVSRFLHRTLLPLVDVVAIVLLTSLFELAAGIPFSGLRWRTSLLVALLALPWGALFGIYDRPVKLVNVLKAMLPPLVVALVVLATGAWDMGPWLTVAEVLLAGGGLLISRLVLHALRVRGHVLRDQEQQRVLAVGSPTEARTALALLWQTHFGLGRQEQVRPEELATTQGLKAMQRRIRRGGFDEVVFCAGDLSWASIIALMEKLKRTGATFKIAQPGVSYIIGSSSIESVHDLHIMERHAVNSAAGRRRKRIVDIGLSLFLFACAPVLVWLVRSPGGLFRNIGRVLAGRASWVGFHPLRHRQYRLPPLRPGIIDPVTVLDPGADRLTVDRVNITYAKDYHPLGDIRLALASLPRLGG
ncbi:MAG: glycosyltransferase [Flavobacteriales bacterium]|nr:glycosyltransferase [Flavobacteriales bacterium]